MKSAASLALVLILFGFSAFMLTVWWKLFKKGVQRQKDTLAILDKKLELSIREKGLQGTIKSKKFLLFVATAVVFIVLAHLIQRVIGG